MVKRMAKLWVALAALVLVAGCEAEIKEVNARTQIMLRIYSNDEMLLAEMKQLRVQLFMGTDWTKRAENVIAARELTWPVDIPVLPPSQASFGQFEVIIEALGVDDKVLAQTRAVTSFVPEERRVLELSLFVCPGRDISEGFVCAEERCHGRACKVCNLEGSCVRVNVTEEDALLPLDGGPSGGDDADAGRNEPGSSGCEPNATRCQGGKVWRCNARGDSETSATCSGDSNTCTEETCPEGGTACSSVATSAGAVACILSNGEVGTCEGASCTCGGAGQPCCKGGECGGLGCDSKTNTCGSCGGLGQPCCPDDTCTPGRVCADNGYCSSCGGVGEPCCGDNQCGDGDPCNGLESCADGMCVAGAPLVCADDNSCTKDECVAKVGCVSTGLEDGTSCNDSDGCTQTDKCVDSVCKGSNPKMCAPPTPICDDGTCMAPPSCLGLAANCGVSGTSSCCEQASVPGGTFARSYDAVTATNALAEATVSGFVLDRMEVTVGRFRRFVEDGKGVRTAAPPSGAGAVSDKPDTGWNGAWTTSLTTDTSSLRAALACNGAFQTWTASASNNENRPITCVTWYEAFAFCIWDGGRLPSEAEWNFVAAGGAEQRVYPWSSPATSTAIDANLASYYVDDTKQCFGDGANGCSASDVRVVGSKTGIGRWGHYDLSGNAAEWVLDYYARTYGTPCTDCVQVNAATSRVFRGGGFTSAGLAVSASYRDAEEPLTRRADIGFRCVYAR